MKDGQQIDKMLRVHGVKEALWDYREKSEEYEALKGVKEAAASALADAQFRAATASRAMDLAAQRVFEALNACTEPEFEAAVGGRDSQ